MLRMRTEGSFPLQFLGGWSCQMTQAAHALHMQLGMRWSNVRQSTQEHSP